MAQCQGRGITNTETKGEFTGEIAEGCFDVQVSARREHPNIVDVYASQMVFGNLESGDGWSNYRLVYGAEAAYQCHEVDPETGLGDQRYSGWR